MESFVEEIAKLIVTKNLFSLLLLFEAIWILFFFPGGIAAQGLKSTFDIEFPKQYPAIFWFVALAIFVTALVIAIRKIQKKPPALPDFTERKAIKGLRAFGEDDAEIFAQLQREKDLRECLESLTSNSFRFGILMGESGVGKSSFLQAGILPQLAREEISAQGIYIRFSNRDPFETVYQTLVKELKISETANDQQNLLEIFSLAVAATDKSLILIFDQFEQFFVHCKQKSDRKPFINGLKDWYLASNPLPIKILISIRGDLADRLIEIQKALGYSLSPQEVFRLERFTPEEATKVLQVIALAEELKFDEGFVRQLTAEELASREDGLISPVDLQVLAWTIEGQDSKELQAFSRNAFQKIGGIEGLMTRFLNRTLEARVTEVQKQAAIKVLFAMTDLDRNVRVGALTIEDLQQKMQGTLTASEIREATQWLANPGVRLLTPVQQDGTELYELAHERLIPALREVAGKELTSADKANQLLDRRVNEWLGNRRSSRYLFNWRELGLIRQQKPFLVWGANHKNKEKLLQRSWRRLYKQLVAVGMVLVFGLVGLGWWYSPQGQIQQVRWELPDLSERVSYEYRAKAAIAFLKNGNLQQTSAIVESISDSYFKAEVLTTIAETYGKIEDFPEAAKSLEQAIAA
ncbi:NACHT domain protein, partial [Xenococcus sp. PCC 7305]